MPRLIAEWEPQEAVLLAWPHGNTDWQPILPQVTAVYEELAVAIARHVRLIVVVPEGAEAGTRQKLEVRGVAPNSLHVYAIPTNDTWVRDYGPLTVESDNGLVMLDYQFNAWGNKCPSALDNAVTKGLFAANAFSNATRVKPDFVLEGGAIETDGQGTLLTTESCLLNPNRNPGFNRDQTEARLKKDLGVSKINWLSHGHLAGDDTDGHIDTLARLCPNNCIAYVKCDNPADEHFAALAAMEEELMAMTDAQGRPYTLVPLPWPAAQYAEDGHRLPATYANFLIINGAVLVPTYNDKRDNEALAQVSKAFPGYRVEGVHCLPLIHQHGSLHCATMQLPKGVLGIG